MLYDQKTIIKMIKKTNKGAIDNAQHEHSTNTTKNTSFTHTI